MKKLNHSKKLTIVFDQELEGLKGKVLFPEKLEKANDILKRTTLPKIEKA